MFVENLEDLPEGLRSQFVEVEIEGKKGFQDKDSAELRRHLFNVKDENKRIKDSKADIESKLNEFEANQEKKIQEARDKALEDAKSKGDVKAIEERYEQQMEDLKTRVAKETREATIKEMATERATEKAASISKQIGAQLGVDNYAGDVIAQIIANRVMVDPDTQKEIYHDDKGGALSVDKAGFVEELKKDPRLARLIKSDVPSNGGGNVNGSGQGGAAGKKFNEMSGAELSALRKQDPAEYTRLKNEYHSN